MTNHVFFPNLYAYSKSVKPLKKFICIVFYEFSESEQHSIDTKKLLEAEKSKLKEEQLKSEGLLKELDDLKSKNLEIMLIIFL